MHWVSVLYIEVSLRWLVPLTLCYKRFLDVVRSNNLTAEDFKGMYILLTDRAARIAIFKM